MGEASNIGRKDPLVGLLPVRPQRGGCYMTFVSPRFQVHCRQGPCSADPSDGSFLPELPGTRRPDLRL
jgi:hypothetical protein